MRFDVLSTGDIRCIYSGDILLNSLLCGQGDAMPGNLFLRIHQKGSIAAYPLLGKAACEPLEIHSSQEKMTCHGQISKESIEYVVRLRLKDHFCFWDVEITNQGAPKEVDILYGQDVGLGTSAHILSNEAYNAQYIDNSVFETEQGFVLCFRQNQKQPTGHPFLQVGGLRKTVGYSTDGYQFFGLKYKNTQEIAALSAPSLENCVYQYEFTYAALQSEKAMLKETATFSFYLAYLPDLHTAVERPIPFSQVQKAYAGLRQDTDTKPLLSSVEGASFWQAVGSAFSSLPVSEKELLTLYPERRLEERENGELLSFFTPTSAHVVLREKEIRCERPHGNIIRTGALDAPPSTVLASSQYMFGVFGAQIVFGNTKYNTLTTVLRNGLNVMKASGLRLYLKMEGQFRLLCMPAAYEMGLNYGKWLYRLPEDWLEVRAYTSPHHPTLQYEVISHQGAAYEVAAFWQVLGSSTDGSPSLGIAKSENRVVISRSPNDMACERRKGLAFTISATKPFAFETLPEPMPGAEEKGSAQEQTFEMHFQPESHLHFAVVAYDAQSAEPTPVYDFEKAACDYLAAAKASLHHFHLSLESGSEQAKHQVEKLNDTVLWYSHNAGIHYATPHGLEQFGGAAWGSRDVCQGPTELFLALENHKPIQDILYRLYAHQYENGNWPQWFMFDEYGFEQQKESHGDIVVWPLMALTEYLSATGDTAILEHPLSYTQKESCLPTSSTETLFKHVKRQLAYIKAHFVSGTHLSEYGNGDWDDTLCPADSGMRKKMISAWTVALTYQAFKGFSSVLHGIDPSLAAELEAMAESIRKDFNEKLIRDGVLAGFLLKEGETEQCILHPSDVQTGMQYRLVPMTRAVIGSLFTPEQARAHAKMIEKELLFPDGVRLMNHTRAYHGGVSQIFQRAETAANFGREIGLMYAHAHVRYIEAMATADDREKAWDSLFTINPILPRDKVPNAALRQSNCYSSSSDGDFKTRYEAMERFEELRKGTVQVKGGWRIYSSGSGIYIGQLVRGILGIRRVGDAVHLSPTLPKALDGLSLTFAIGGKPVEVRYHYGAKSMHVLVDGIKIGAEEHTSVYGKKRLILPVSAIQIGSILDIWMEER